MQSITGTPCNVWQILLGRCTVLEGHDRIFDDFSLNSKNADFTAEVACFSALPSSIASCLSFVRTKRRNSRPEGRLSAVGGVQSSLVLSLQVWP